MERIVKVETIFKNGNHNTRKMLRSQYHEYRESQLRDEGVDSVEIVKDR